MYVVRDKQMLFKVSAQEHRDIFYLVERSDYANMAEFMRNICAAYAESIGESDIALSLRTRSITGNMKNKIYFHDRRDQYREHDNEHENDDMILQQDVDEYEQFRGEY